MTGISVARDFDFHSPEYRKLLRESNATAFQHPDWLDSFYRILVPAHAVEPNIVIGRDRASGELQFVLPLIRAENSVQYASLGVTDYACPVMRRDAVRATRTLSGEVRAAIGDSPLEIAPVRLEHTADWRELLGIDPVPLPFMAHSMPVAPPGSDGRSQPFSARRRNDLARKANRLGRLELEVVHGEEIAELFFQARAFRHGRFENDPLQHAHGLEFYIEVASRGDLSGLSRTFRLSHGGHTVAMLFGLVDGPSFRYIILACDYAQFSDFSPGMLIFERTIAHWAKEAGRVFDFTIGDEPYKRELGCTPTPMFAFTTK